ncbi:hypothetical protein L3Q82_009550, partial [Scortum barcoo]
MMSFFGEGLNGLLTPPNRLISWWILGEVNKFLCEVEAIINGHPITKASTDPCDLEASQNHLLLLKPYIFTTRSLPSSRMMLAGDGGKYNI